MNVQEQLDATIMMSRWPEEGDFRSRCLATMRAARNDTTWTTDADGQFRVALAVILTKAEGDDKTWAEGQVRAIRLFNAWLQAAQAGLTVEPPTIEEGETRDYALMGLWRESA